MDQFSEYLKIYSTLVTNDEKVNFVKSIVEEGRVPQVLLALESKDVDSFNKAMEDVKEAPESATEPQVTESTQVPTPELAESEEYAEVAVPEVEPTSLTESQAQIVAPTVDAVAEMNNDIKKLTDEDVEKLPESVKEGVHIWKDASEDFTRAIIAGTVARLHHGEFSEIEEPSEKEILTTGAEVAKELKAEDDANEHKTSLDKAVEDIAKETNESEIDTLIQIHGELMALKSAAETFVDFISEKDDLELKPSTKDAIVSEVLDNGLFEGDGLNKDLMSKLNESRDYSSRDYSEKMKIYTDFSEVEAVADDDEIHEATMELLNEAKSFDVALEAVEESLKEKGVHIDAIEADEQPASELADGEMVGAPVAEGDDQSKDCAEMTPASIGSLAAYMVGSPQFTTPVAEVKASTPVILKQPLTVGGRSVIQESFMKNVDDLNNWDKKSALYKGLHPFKADKMGLIRKSVSDPNTAFKYVLPTIGKASGVSIDKQLGTGNMVTTALGDVGDILLKGQFSEDEKVEAPVDEVVENVDVTASDAQVIMEPEAEATEAPVAVSSEQVCPIEATKCSDCSEEEVEKEASDIAAEQGLGSSDMIQALIEKYRMLPTLETKNFMIEDLRVKGFDESVIDTIKSMAAGEFSEEPEAPASEPVEEPAPVEDVAIDLFNDLLGTNDLGLTDEVDGTLAPGALVENGAEDTDIYSGLGTDPVQMDIPMADPRGDLRREEVRQAVEGSKDIVPEAQYPEDDSFESIL